MANLAPQNIRDSKSKLIEQLPSLKHTLNSIVTKNDIEPIKPFTTVFALKFSKDFRRNYPGNNPMEYFQKGVEVLYLLINEIYDKDKALYTELSDYGEYYWDIETIVDEINLTITTS